MSRVSFRCRSTAGGKISVDYLSDPQRVYIAILGDPATTVALPPEVARHFAAAIIAACDRVEGK